MLQTVQDYLDDPQTTEAEKALIAACREGEACVLNDGKLPEEGDESVTVRAGLIRLLAMEATSLHERGVILGGARITGKLDLSFARCRGRLALDYCRFEEEPQMAQAELAELSLLGSHLPKGLLAQGAKVAGAVFLNGVTARGEVSLHSARIGALLSCESATFENAGGKALNAQGMRVTGSFLFRKIAAVMGRIELSSAHVKGLFDDAASWAMCDDINLIGFTYDLIGGPAAPKTFVTRKSWLKKGSWFQGEFRPQPYTQFANAMRAAGHEAEARKALIERDRQLGLARRRSLHNRARGGRRYLALENPLRDLHFLAHFLWDTTLRWLTGYGFAPGRTILAMLVLIGVGWGMAHQTWEEGAFAPNSDVILVSPGWQALLAQDCRPPPGPPGCVANPARAWSDDPANGMDWDSFHALGYAADLVIPIIDLGQTAAWAPSKDRGAWGRALWWGRWVLAGLGWIVTALGAAAVTGLMQRNAPR